MNERHLALAVQDEVLNDGGVFKFRSVTVVNRLKLESVLAFDASAPNNAP